MAEAETIEIVQVDAEGAVTKTWHDAFPGGWMAARTEFGKMRNGEAGAAAREAGDVLELRVNGQMKLTTAAKKDERKKRASKSEGGAPKKKPAAKKKKADDMEAEEEEEAEEAEGAEPAEPVMAKMSGYMYFLKENRAAAVAAVEADEEHKDKSSKEKNQLVMKKGAEMWKALDDAGKQKWKDDAPMVEKKAKKPKKDKGEPAPKKKKAAGKIADKAGLEAQMEADGWTVEEKPREGSKHVDKAYCPPGGGKKLRSVLEVARAAYPQFLSEEEREAVASKPKPKKKKTSEAPAGGKAIDEYYLGGSKAADGDAEMADAAEPEAAPEEDAEMAEPEPEAEAADGDAEMADAPAQSDYAKAEAAYTAARDPKAKKTEENTTWVDDGGKASREANLAWKAEEAAADAAERESKDPRAREAWAYRAQHPDKQRTLEGKIPLEIAGAPEHTNDDEAMRKKQNEMFETAHPPTERLKKEMAEHAKQASPTGAEQPTESEPVAMDVN